MSSWDKQNGQEGTKPLQVESQTDSEAVHVGVALVNADCHFQIEMGLAHSLRGSKVAYSLRGQRMDGLQHLSDNQKPITVSHEVKGF